MTRVGDFGDTMQKDAVPAVSSDVVFDSSRFPNYRIGANNQTVEGKDDRKVLSMKEVVARETAQLLDQQNRLSIRDLASKFEKGLAAAAKLSEEARLREEASLEKHALLKKLRDALESLKGLVAGKNKDDVVDAISMVFFGIFGGSCLNEIIRNCLMQVTERNSGHTCSTPIFSSHWLRP